MIDHRFSLTQHAEHKHLYRLHFSVVIPPERYYVHQYPSILDICKRQYPELVFDYQGDYSARFPDKQYARCTQCRVKDNYVEELVFSLPLGLDDIMAATCSFKKAVPPPPLEFSVDPASLVDLTPDDFHEEVENMYALRHNLSLRIRAVDWAYFSLDFVSGEPVYLITPTDYDYI